MRVLPRRLSVLGLAAPLLFVLGIAGALYLARSPGDPLVVPIRDLGAYHQIQSGDLKTIVRRRHSGRGKFTRATDLIGRYGLAPLHAGEPVSEAAVGPRLPDGALDHVTVIGVSLVRGAGTNRAIEPGNQLQIVFSAIAAPAPIGDVWILAKSKDSASAVLALPTDRQSDFAINAPKGYLISTLSGTPPASKSTLTVTAHRPKPVRRCGASVRCSRCCQH